MTKRDLRKDIPHSIVYTRSKRLSQKLQEKTETNVQYREKTHLIIQALTSHAPLTHLSFSITTLSYQE